MHIKMTISTISSYLNMSQSHDALNAEKHTEVEKPNSSLFVRSRHRLIL